MQRTHRLKDGHTVVPDVPAGRESQPAHQPRPQVAQDVPVEVGHHQDIEIRGVLHQLHMYTHACVSML